MLDPDCDYQTSTGTTRLAERITTGKQPEALAEFDPLRRTGH